MCQVEWDIKSWPQVRKFGAYLPSRKAPGRRRPILRPKTRANSPSPKARAPPCMMNARRMSMETRARLMVLDFLIVAWMRFWMRLDCWLLTVRRIWIIVVDRELECLMECEQLTVLEGWCECVGVNVLVSRYNIRGSKKGCVCNVNHRRRWVFWESLYSRT